VVGEGRKAQRHRPFCVGGGGGCDLTRRAMGSNDAGVALPGWWKGEKAE
jgi:hypothetical protein